jgi:Cu/Ag efflux pump CusA
VIMPNKHNANCKNRLKLPSGYAILWSGQHETALRVQHRLMLIVPVTIAIILFLLYCNTRSAVKTMIGCPGGSEDRDGPSGRFIRVDLLLVP